MEAWEIHEKLVELLMDKDVIYESNGVYFGALVEDAPLNGRISEVALELFKWIKNQ